MSRRCSPLTLAAPQPPMSTPLPWYAQFFGDPKCDLCIGAGSRLRGAPCPSSPVERGRCPRHRHGAQLGEGIPRPRHVPLPAVLYAGGGAHPQAPAPVTASARACPSPTAPQCERQVETMRRNLDLRKIVLEGCVDATSISPMEKVRPCALACLAY